LAEEGEYLIAYLQNFSGAEKDKKAKKRGGKGRETNLVDAGMALEGRSKKNQASNIVGAKRRLNKFGRASRGEDLSSLRGRGVRKNQDRT